MAKFEIDTEKRGEFRFKANNDKSILAGKGNEKVSSCSNTFDLFIENSIIHYL